MRAKSNFAMEDIRMEPGQLSEKTRPPVRRLRYESPSELYQNDLYLARLTRLRPLDEESGLAFLHRLRGSTTPEDAVAFAAFAAVPQVAIWWAYEVLRLTLVDADATTRAMLGLSADWIRSPDNANRYRAMQAALYAPVRGPAVYLGLAVGWSGGPIAPNDPAPVAPHRMPQALNTAVLSALAIHDLSARPMLLARTIDLAARLFVPE
ncbi:hypothetical protein R1T40_00115 (plasmid) [Tritonibacter scottomollicae]|uniref:DUF4214 domain-containing protein n=1 Tax=Tritonibacter scottomollicae TaxID=483013 RepID=A0ABZ0HAB8_TRISK|nr:hypothetical protein [Tritonibacter scottomollicae]WOI31406.1 hypothetical protein R1T40_00115 [Tritonibacter scottomollicae]